MAWQPIETAPRDGTRVFAFWHSYGHDYYGCCYFKAFSDGSSGWFGGSAFSVPDGAWTAIAQPTHWMPLPAPPDAPRPDVSRCDHDVTCRHCGTRWPGVRT